MPYIAPSQAQKEVSHNEALNRLDMVVQAVVADRTRTEAPVSPAPGDCHLVHDGATGAWSGQGGKLACWYGTAWVFIPPWPGFEVFDRAEGRCLLYDGSGWGPAAAGSGTEISHVTGLQAALDGCQPLHPVLTALAALSAGGGQLLRATGPHTFDLLSLSAFMAGLLGSASASALISSIGAVSKAGDLALGDVVFGLTEKQSITGIGTPRVQVSGGNMATASLLLAKYGSNSNRPNIIGYRSAGSGPSVFGAVTSGSTLGIESWVDGGAGPVRGAGIYPTVSGTATAAYVPTHIAFFNTDGAGAYGERFRVKADGGLQAGAALADILSAERHFVARIYTRATLPTPSATNLGQARVSNPQAGKTALVYCNGSAWVYEGDGSTVSIA